MVNFAGHTTLTQDRHLVAEMESTSLGGLSLGLPALSLLKMSAFGKGAYALPGQTALPKAALQGASDPSVDQEFFGSILAWPSGINMGLVLSAKTYYLDLWNLTGYAKRLLSFTPVNLDGVTVTNADGSPVNFLATQYRQYRVDVAQAGQAGIDGSIQFDFQGLPLLSVALTGIRLVVFSFEHNWREPVAENLEYLTDILRSYGGKEQRIMLRSNPRRSLEYLFTFEDQNRVARFQSLLWGWQDLVFVVPVWTDATYLTANAPIGSTALSLSTSLRDFAATRVALLWNDFTTWEVVEIASLTASQLNLVKATLSAWTTKTLVIPLRNGRVVKEIPIIRPSSSIAEATLTFYLEPESAIDSNRLGTSSPMQYLGLDVLVNDPVLDDDQEDKFVRDIQTIDASLGSWDSASNDDAPEVTRKHRWILEGRQEIMNFLKFLDNHKGRLVPFWMPSWSRDLELLQTVGATDTGIVVKNILYTQQIKNHAGRSTLAFLPVLTPTVPIIKIITGSSEVNASSEIINLDSSFGTIKTASDFLAISYLVKCRFVEDSFNLVWHNDECVEVSATILEVRQ